MFLARALLPQRKEVPGNEDVLHHVDFEDPFPLIIGDLQGTTKPDRTKLTKWKVAEKRDVVKPLMDRFPLLCLFPGGS